MSESVLQARGLSKKFGKGEGLVRAVDEVDLEVAQGETVAVMGPSGCGKSTLLYLLGGLERPSGGEIQLAGNRVDHMGERALARLRRTAIGFVFQAFTGIVAVLLVHAGYDASLGANAGLDNPQDARLSQVMTVLSVALVVLAVVNAIPHHLGDRAGHHRPAAPGRVLQAAVRAAVPAGRRAARARPA